MLKFALGKNVPKAFKEVGEGIPRNTILLVSKELTAPLMNAKF